MANQVTRAQAHPNIALVKYWGKADTTVNIPATPSLSITLNTLVSDTRVSNATTSKDVVVLDGQATNDLKILGWLGELRKQFSIPPLEIHSNNNFPTASGLASSASGFAALITAINAHCKLGLDTNQCSIWARRASASAARSLHGGWTTLSGPHWHVDKIDSTWPMNVVVAITNRDRKSVPSSMGMAQSKDSSPYYPAWVSSTVSDFNDALRAVNNQDFEALAEIAEHSCLKMHGLMLASRPGLLYWKPATVAVMVAVGELRAQGVPVFFTIDAGPQVKAVCLPEAAAQVEQTLTAIDGVQQTLRVGLGEGARVIESTG